MKGLIALAAVLALAVPVHAADAPRPVEAEGVAPIGVDMAAARKAAIGDALRQAIAAGGMDVAASTTIDRNVVTSDSLWARARARVTGYRLTDEWQDAGLLHIAIEAAIAPVDAPRCADGPLPRLHLGAPVLDIDSAVDPIVGERVRADFDEAMRQAFGARPLDPFAGPQPLPVAMAARSSERYLALAFGGSAGSGIYIRPYLKLARRLTAAPGFAQGQRLEATAALELVDAARGIVIGRVTRDRKNGLSSPLWDYLPADYRPDRRLAEPDMRGLFADLIDDARQFIRCRQVAVAINGVNAGELQLGGGADAGLQVGDLLSVGEPTAPVAGGPEWPLAEVTAVSAGSARARVLGPENRAFPGAVAVRMR